jgi:hypothetical protein
MKTASLIMLSLLVIAIPVASGSAANVPPGNGAATQYTETLPGAGGEEARHGAGAPDGGGKKSVTPAGTAAEMTELGDEGKVALQLANSSAPQHDGEPDDEAGAGASGPGAANDRGGSLGAGADGGGSSGLSAVLGSALGTSGGGLGFLQTLILGTVLLAAAAYVLRRRGGGQPSDR